MAGHLELAPEKLLEQVALAACAPLLELGVVFPREPDHDQRRADSYVDSVDRLTAAAVEAVGDAQERGQLAQPRLAAVPQRAEFLGGARLAAPMPSGDGGEQRDLFGGEAAHPAVLDEVRGVAGMSVGGHVLADVVQERGVLEELAIILVERVQLGGLVEQLEREPGNLAGMVLGK